MRIGIDSYSYHRMLGEVRPGETPARRGFPDAIALVDEMVAAGAEVLSLETAFLPPPGELDVDGLVEAACGRELVLAWGHPYGLRWGTDPRALDELLAWVSLAPRMGATTVRCVAAHPALRGEPRASRSRATVRALARALAHASAHGVTLALENHGDVDAAELLELLAALPALTVCLDTANALRVGDDPVDLARRVASRVAMVHLKDVEDPAGSDALRGPCSVDYGAGAVDLHGVLSLLGGPGPLPVCIELAQLRPGEGDETAMVRRGVAWLAAYRDEQAA